MICNTFSIKYTAHFLLVKLSSLRSPERFFQLFYATPTFYLYNISIKESVWWKAFWLHFFNLFWTRKKSLQSFFSLLCQLDSWLNIILAVFLSNKIMNSGIWKNMQAQNKKTNKAKVNAFLPYQYLILLWSNHIVNC